MRIMISQAELQRIHTHAEQGYPHEVVGILAGQSQLDRSDLEAQNPASDDTSGMVQQAYPLINERADTHNRYKVSGLALMRAERKLEAAGMQILGYYHSHPDHPAQYSEYDRDHALPNLSYMIISVMQGKAVDSLSWRLQEDRSNMLAEQIHIVSHRSKE